MEENIDKLDQNTIQKGTLAGLKKYENLNFLEKYAMYMGVAQILEMRLKQILTKNFDEEFEKLENFTLGQTIFKLKTGGMRKDFVSYAESVKDTRNYITHELILNKVIWLSLVENNPEYYSKDDRGLDKGIYEIEQLMFILEWNDKNGEWK